MGIFVKRHSHTGILFLPINRRLALVMKEKLMFAKNFSVAVLVAVAVVALGGCGTFAGDIVIQGIGREAIKEAVGVPEPQLNIKNQEKAHPNISLLKGLKGFKVLYLRAAKNYRAPSDSEELFAESTVTEPDEEFLSASKAFESSLRKEFEKAGFQISSIDCGTCLVFEPKFMYHTKRFPISMSRRLYSYGTGTVFYGGATVIDTENKEYNIIQEKYLLGIISRGEYDGDVLAKKVVEDFLRKWEAAFSAPSSAATQ